MIEIFKYIISYDGGQLRDSGDFEWGLFDSYGEAEEAANDAKEEYMNDWDIEGSEYDPDDFCIEIVEVQKEQFADFQSTRQMERIRI